MSGQTLTLTPHTHVSAEQYTESTQAKFWSSEHVKGRGHCI